MRVKKSACPRAFYVLLSVAQLLLLSLLAACTQSSWMLSGLYDRLDTQLVGYFNEFADFNPSQQAWITAEIERFHYWHRRQLMPSYAALMRDVSNNLSHSNGDLDRARVDAWSEQLRDSFRQMAQCSPLNAAATFFEDLDDNQVESIARRVEEELEEDRESLTEHDDEERLQRAVKWFGRFGLDLDDAQVQTYRDTRARGHDLRHLSLQARAEWNVVFVSLLRQRRQAGKLDEMSSHLAKLNDLTETRFAMEYAENRRLWRHFSWQLLNSLSAQQKAEFTRWLNNTAANVVEIATADVDELTGTAAATACG